MISIADRWYGLRKKQKIFIVYLFENSIGWLYPFAAGNYAFTVGDRHLYISTLRTLRKYGIIEYEGTWRDPGFKVRLQEDWRYFLEQERWGSKWWDNWTSLLTSS